MEQRLSLVTLGVADVGRARRVLRSGAETVWGGHSGLFADPDGHRWEVAHNPGWPLADDGSVLLP